MASSLKTILRKKVNKDGTYPLAVRLTIDRKSTYIYLGENLKEADWDANGQKVRKSHPNSVRINNIILQKKAELNAKLLEMELQHKNLSSKTVRQQIKSKRGGSFFTQAAIFIENLRKHGKFSRLHTEEYYIRQFKEFQNGEDIAFPDITVALLIKFKAYLKGTCRISERTIANHLVTIRTIFNQAITDGLVDRKHYPFGQGKIKIKFPDSLKIGLNAEEVKLLESLDLSVNLPYRSHARNIWLVSFYFAGMRVSDVLRLKHSDFQDDRLHYTMGKNAKGGALKVSEKVLRILEQYPKTGKHDLIFPELQQVGDLKDAYTVQQKIASAIKRLDRNLELIARQAGIQKKLTMHIARHTFGNISGDKIPIQLLQKLYRHTSITTTIGYQGNFIHKDTDDALEAVIGV